MKNTLLTVAFLAVGSLLFTPAPSLAVGYVAVIMQQRAIAIKALQAFQILVHRKWVGVCGCYNPEGNGHCGAAGGFNPCLNQEYADTHRHE